MKPKNLIILTIILSLRSVYAQSSLETEWLEKYSIYEDVSFGVHPEQIMDVYLSKTEKHANKKYTIVFLHGGGYYLSDKSQEVRYVRPYLEKGFNVVNMNYRLKQGIPLATEDLTLALNFLEGKNSDYNLNLKRIILTGFSAGAHIATNVGVAQNNKEYPYKLNRGVKIVGIINFSGPVDGLDVVEKAFSDSEVEMMKNIGKALFPDTEDYAPEEIISVFEPISYLDNDDPAIFIWHGGLDEQISPQTFETFVAILNNDPSKNLVIFDPEAGHSPTDESLAKSYVKIFDFIQGL